MTRPAWRLIDDLDGALDAAGQMQADVELLDEVAAGAPPALRLYRWAPPAISLGRFQAASDVDVAACDRRGVEVVRRPTGARCCTGRISRTRSRSVPTRSAARDVDATYGWIAGALIDALDRLGVRAAVARNDGPAGPVCFAGQQGADLRVGDRKVCGSAQVHRGGATLQHGSVLLTRLDFDETDLLVGDHDRAHLRRATVTLEELGAPHDARTVARALIEGFAAALRIELSLVA